MHFILQIPLEVRLTLLFLVGVAVAGQLNRGIYRLAWNARRIGPWSPPPDEVPPRHWSDRIPVLGWWGLRRESPWQGRAYWVRPMLLELGTGVAFALLYWFETERFLLWPALPELAPPSPAVLHAQFLSHIVLICLMIVATFIDFDEQTIPDAITVTGTVAAMLLAVAIPYSALPTLHDPAWDLPSTHHLVLTSSTTVQPWWEGGLGGPYSWPPLLDGYAGLMLGVLGIWAWCLAILHKTWTLRHGFVAALRYLVASVLRRRTWPLPLALGISLSLVIVVTWLAAADPVSPRWQSLLTAVAGICFGGGLIWAVRVVGGHALGVEAMGFGDVTLMAMIGAFLGWQTALLIFFVAPLAALGIAAAQRIFSGDQHIAFGPYLCLAAVIVLCTWNGLWNQWARPMFSLGWFIPAVLACCLLLMGGMLGFWRIVRSTLGS